MLGLSQEVRCYELCTSTLIGDDHDLGWACGQVDRSALWILSDLLFGDRYPRRSRAKDFVYFWYGFGSIRHTGDCLCATDRKDFGNAT